VPDLPRDPSRNPLFQVMFSLQEDVLERHLAGDDLRVAPYTCETGVAKFDLTLTLTEQAQGYQGEFEYNTQLFDAPRIRRMAEHFERLLAGVCADPAAPLGRLPLLSVDEYAQVVHGWNRTDVAVPSLGSVAERVQAQARQAPGRLALADDDRQLSYGQLERWAGQVADRLAGCGVVAGDRVGVCLRRSVPLVVVQLGVLKLGAAYVPLDPDQPPERLGAMLSDCAVRVLVAEADRLAVAADLACTGVPVGDLESLPAPSARPLPAIDAQTPAYVIYTSGSTGKPKGVSVPHGALNNLIHWHQSVYGIGPDDRATQLSGPGFDASVWDIWPYLTAGASVHIPSDAVRVDPVRLVAWLSEQAITRAFMPTPLAEAALDQPWPVPSPLRTLLTGGDQLTRRPPADAPFELVNHYGPTEGAVVSTCGPVSAHGAGLPDIGHPILNVRTYVLDGAGQAVPIGVPGELYIGGENLALGYLNHPELTAQAFVANPLADAPPGRLYRTGDLVRYLEDGRLDFIGRKDQQVQIRGYRIELGEVEAALRGALGVLDAAAVVHGDGPATRSLIAYVVPAVAGGLSVAELRAALRERLPEPMVPKAVVFLDALPLSASGKIDRRRLPEPSPQAYDTGAYVAPRNALESQLVLIWEAAFERRPIGVTDNFFDLGGHSLIAIRIAAQIQQELHVELPLRAILTAPTVDSLALTLLQVQCDSFDEGTIDAPLDGGQYDG